MQHQFYRPGIHWLVAIAILALSACDNREPTNAATPANTATVTDSTKSPAESAVTEPTAAEAELALRGVTETEGLATTTGDQDETALSQPTKTADTANGDWKYKEGVDFRRMATAQGTSSPPDKIEVAEIFWYGCPHCYNFDPIISEWNASKPDNVAFVRIPVIWNPTNQIHARLMYTAEALGVMDKAHGAIFKAIHEGGSSLTTEPEMIKLFAEFGVDEKRFREAFNSFGVTSAIKRAENLTRRYGIKSVPVLVVNGKYATDAPNIKTFGDMIAVTNELIAREQQELSAP